MLKPGDLVIHDGWYGIISNLELRTVLCGNGCDAILEEEEFAALQPVGQNNFIELIEFYKLRYDPTVKIIRLSVESER